MKVELLELLRCPNSGQRLTLEPVKSVAKNNIESGWLISEDGEHRWAVRNGIPRFVPESNYADNFGLQWNKFRQTQLDSFSGHPISGSRFWKETGWMPDQLLDQWVLDAGCGAGRFAEVALKAGAKVVALDYSSAVDACYENLRRHANLHVVQGDIYKLPFAPGAFSFVYSLGVLQHTPDVAKAFFALPPMVRTGGGLCVDYYAKSFKSMLLPKYWLRPIAKLMSKAALFSVLQKVVPVLLPISWLVGRIPLVGNVLKRGVPVANHYGILPLNEMQQREWSLLDTFDWLSPTYDKPQTESTARMWMERAYMNEIEVFDEGHLVARGRK